MEKFEKVLEYLSTKEWNLVPNWKSEIEKLTSKLANKDLNIEDRKAIKNFTKRFKEPLFFKHDTTTYKTGRIYAPYVLLPNKKIMGVYLKDLIVPEKDYFFVSFDFSSSQIRHIAVYKELDWLKEMFEKGIDIYEEFSKKANINNRDRAKIIMLILMFGGDSNTIENKFGLELGNDVAEKAVEIFDEWFDTKDLSYQEKVALNHYIQAKEVEYFKKKMIYIHKKQNKEFRLHAFIHDEVIMEIHKDHMEHVEKIKKYLEKNTEIKMEAKVSISKTFQMKG